MQNGRGSKGRMGRGEIEGGRGEGGGARGGAQRSAEATGGAVAGGRGAKEEVRVLMSGEIRRRIGMWVCRCSYNHFPRNLRCNACGCGQNRAVKWVQEWWAEERLPWNWRGANHPITIGTAKGGGGKGKGGRTEEQGGGVEARQAGPANATRPKAQARPKKRAATGGDGAIASGEEEEGASVWQRGGLSAKERKKAKRKDAEARTELGGGDVEMESECGSAEQEDTRRQRTQPIELPEIPRVALVRRLEARRAELEEEKREGGSAVRLRKLERRIRELDQKIKLSGGHTNRRQSFAIIDTEKAITRMEGNLEEAEREVEQRQRALQEAKDECEEIQQKLSNMRKRLAHITAQKAQESTQKQDAEAVRKALATMQRLAGDNDSDEIKALLLHFRRLYPMHDEEEENDETLSSSSAGESTNGTVAFMDADWDGGSNNESEFESGKLAEIKETRKRLAELQQELKTKIEEATVSSNRAGKRARSKGEEDEEEEVPTLSAGQTARAYRARIKEAAAVASRAQDDARKEVVPQIEKEGSSMASGKKANKVGGMVGGSQATGRAEAISEMGKDGASAGQGEAGGIATRTSAARSVAERWETAEQREARNSKGKGGREGMQRSEGEARTVLRGDIEKAKRELAQRTGTLRAAVEANKQIRLQERMQAQQDLERLAMDVARAHATGAETEQEAAEIQIYWTEAFRAAVEESSRSMASPLVGTYRRGRAGGGERRGGNGTSRFKSVAARPIRVPSQSGSSSGMELSGDSSQRRRKRDRTRKAVSRSPRGYRARSCGR